MPKAPAQRQRSSNARVTFAPEVAAIPEEEPLKNEGRGGSKKAAAAAISSGNGGGGGKGAAASSSSALQGAQASDEAVGYYAEAGCWPQQLLRRARWPVMPHFSDIGSGTWLDIFYLTTVVTSSPSVVATLPYGLKQLTWIGGSIVLVVLWASSFYCTMLLAKLHQWRPTMRYCRYRDLAKSIWGMPGFYCVFVLQQLASISTVVAVQISTAAVCKEMSGAAAHVHGQTLSIFAFITIFGAAQLVLCQLPTLRTLRHLNALATMATFVFAACTLALCVYDGQRLDRSKVSYNLDPKLTPWGTVAQVFSGMGTIGFSFINPMAPEIQAITKAPAVPAGYKGVSAAFALMAVVFPIVAAPAFWAYGQDVPVLILLLEANPTWLLRTLQLIYILYSVLNWQVIARVTTEVIDCLLLDPTDGNMLSRHNVLGRLGGSAVYVLTVSYIASIIPTHYDEITVIVASMGFFSLNLVLPLLLYNSCFRPPLLLRWANAAMAAVWATVMVGSVIASVYFFIITVRREGLKIFADFVFDPKPVGLVQHQHQH